MKTQQPAESRNSEDKGFYIILVLCLAAIAVSAYILFWMPDSSSADVQTQTPIVQTMEPESEDPEPTDEPESDSQSQPKTAQTVAEPDSSALSASAQETDPTASETFGKAKETDDGFVLPVKNTGVLKVFSEDTLQYDVTMADWRVHKATDYAGAIGDRVYAIGSGTVTDVSQDPMYGNCVTLDLGQGLTCRYTGLSDKVKVKKDQAVKAGALIGAIGDSNLMESQMESHLHLEMYRDGQIIDPEEVLPQKEE